MTIPLPKGQWGISGDIFACPTGRRRCFWHLKGHLEARDAAKYPVMHRISPKVKN